MKHSRRYDSLDALRGVAAVMVVLFHLGGWTGRPWLVQHGYLAVDFFFCLSGFVMAHAYEARLNAGMSWTTFMTARLVRLWPLIALSMPIGAAYFILKAVVSPDAVPPIPTTLGYLALGLLVIPAIWTVPPAYYHRIFPMNGPVWSLFLEIAANALWAPIANRLSNRWLAALLAASGAVLFGVGFSAGTLELGAVQATFWAGVPRVVFSFGAGLACYRLHTSMPGWLRARAIVTAAILAGCLLIPVSSASRLLDPLLVVLVFPAIVLLASHQTAAEGSKALAIWRFSGDLSYPLYTMHAPVWFLVVATASLVHAPKGAASVFAAALVVIPVAATLALKVYDQPARAFLGRVLLRRGRTISVA